MGSCHQFVQDGACPTRLGTEMRRLPVRGSCRDLWAFLESLHHFSQSSWKAQSIWSCCSGPTWGLPGILAGWPRWRLCFWERGAQGEAGPSLPPARLPRAEQGPPEALPGRDGEPHPCGGQTRGYRRGCINCWGSDGPKDMSYNTEEGQYFVITVNGKQPFKIV